MDTGRFLRGVAVGLAVFAVVYLISSLVLSAAFE